MLVEQQEGAEELVRALRQELHSLRQDTISVAANARQTVSEKEALQVALHLFCCACALGVHHRLRRPEMRFWTRGLRLAALSLVWSERGWDVHLVHLRCLLLSFTCLDTL